MNISKQLTARTLSSLVLATVVSGGLMPSSAQAARKRTAGKITWNKNFENALKQAKKTGRPVFVDFYATWCGPCKLLDETVFPSARVTQAMKPYIAVKVDIDTRPDLVQRYKLLGYPSMGFFSPSGKLVKLQTGIPLPKRKFTSDAQALQAATFELSKMLRTYKSQRAVGA